MQAEEFDHIRADVHQAILEAQHHDPTVTLEILFRLLDLVGEVATGEVGGIGARGWADAVLRDVQTRAVSKVPYGEEQTDLEPPEDHR